jgi:hypothetical protein
MPNGLHGPFPQNTHGACMMSWMSYCLKSSREGGGGVAHLKVDKRFQMRNLGCPILTAKVHEQHPPAHHVGWMWFGQETLFHYISVLTINHLQAIYLPTSHQVYIQWRQE